MNFSFTPLFLFFDVFSIGLSYWLTEAILRNEQPLAHKISAGLFFIVLSVFFLSIQDLYHLRIFFRRLLLTYRIVRMAFLNILAYSLLTFVFQGIRSLYPSETLLVAIPLAACFLIFNRCFLLPSLVLPALSSFFPDYFFKKVWWMNDDPSNIVDLDSLFKDKLIGCRIVRKSGLQVELTKDTSSVDIICITLPDLSFESLQNLINRFLPSGKPLWIFSPLFHRLPIQDTWITYNKVPGLYVSNTRERKPYAFTKRCLDILLSAAGLVVILPILPIIALGIKLSSPGPVLFRQKRVGYKGKEFVCLKFRTMHQDKEDTIHRKYLEELISAKAQEKEIYKIQNDPRLTWFGNLLRKSSLDELPQLVNVLMGSMSLVGPRPSIPYEVANYEKWFLQRLDVKPGLTGVWQVYGRSRVPFDTAMFLDIFYTLNKNLLYDFRLIIKTIIVVLSGKGAY